MKIFPKVMKPEKYLREQSLRLLDLGREYLDPARLIADQMHYEAPKRRLYIQGQRFNLGDYRNVVLIGAGDRASRAAVKIESMLGNDLSGGVAISPNNLVFRRVSPRLGFLDASNQTNYRNTEDVIRMLEPLNSNDLVLFIISEGADELLNAPAGVSFEDHARVKNLLGTLNMSHEEQQSVLKRFSRFNGGRMAKLAYPASVIGLILADSKAMDPLATGGGPTVRDTTTIADTMKLINQHQILHKLGIDACDLMETPKTPEHFEKVANFVLASNEDIAEAIAAKAHDLGLRPEAAPSDVVSEEDEPELYAAWKKFINQP